MVTSPASTQKTSSSQWCTCRGPAKPGGFVISTIVIWPAVSSAVALITARLSNHQRASPSSRATATSLSVGARFMSWVIASSMGFMRDRQSDDRVPLGAVVAAAQHLDALRPSNEREVARLHDPPSIGDVGARRPTLPAPTARSPPRHALVVHRLRRGGLPPHTARRALG